MFKIKREDLVELRKGRDRGKRGTVRELLIKEGKAIVADVNIMKRHVKPGQTTRGGNTARQAGIIDIEAPVQIANLSLVCKACGQPTRVGFRVLEDQTKARFCKKCGELT